MPLPAPPDQASDPNAVENVIPSVRHTGVENVLSAMGNKGLGVAAQISGQPREDFDQSTIGKLLGQHYTQRLNDARRHYQNARNFDEVLSVGLSPQTGEPLTDDERQQYMGMREGAWTDYQKAAGANPDAKKQIESQKQASDSLLEHGIDAVHGLLSHVGILPKREAKADATAQAPATSLPAPPAASGAAGSSAGPIVAGTPGSVVGKASTAAVGINVERLKQAQAAGLAGPDGKALPGRAEEFSRFMATGTFPPVTHFQSKTGYDPRNPGVKVTVKFNPLTGEHLDANDQVIPDFVETGTGPAATATKVLQPSGGGPPYGLNIGGNPKLPSDRDWTAANQKELDEAIKSYRSGNEAKEHLAAVSAKARGDAFARTRIYGVVNKENGELGTASAADITAHPDLYAMAPQAMQVMNRSTVFDEIDYSKDMLQRALDKMGPEEFSTTARAQASVVLRSEDPRNALDSFLHSEVATELSDAQIEYVTALASARESSLAMRMVGGLGNQGSDKMRDAVLGMLPGPNTPTKAFAQRQIDLYDGQIDTLRKSVPGMGSTVPRGGNTPPRPAGVPSEAIWNKDTRRWQMPK